MGWSANVKWEVESPGLNPKIDLNWILLLPAWQTAHMSIRCRRVNDLQETINLPCFSSGASVWKATCLAAGPWHLSQSIFRIIDFLSNAFTSCGLDWVMKEE